MRKNNLTALLTDLRALILKSRPAYRDFLGEVTEAKTTKILENVVLAENQMMLPVADAAFSGFIVGEAYRVVLNGEEKSVIAKDSINGQFLSNAEDIENPPNDSWLLGYNSEAGKMAALTAGTFLGATISVYYDDTVTTQKWSVKKLAYELLPDRLLSALSAAANTARKALTAANAAQNTADAAQIAADNAQTTADNAQTTADNAKTTAETALTSINDSFIQEQKEFLFDKKTVGRDSFRFNAFSHYKIAEFAPSKESVVSFEGTSENGESSSSILHGTGCDKYGLFIVVTSTNNPTLPLRDDGSSVEISPPSTGLYARYEEGNTFLTAGTAKFTLSSKQAVVLVSSTPNSTKKFKITVDDAGTLSATEVTDTTT